MNKLFERRKYLLEIPHEIQIVVILSCTPAERMIVLV